MQFHRKPECRQGRETGIGEGFRKREPVDMGRFPDDGGDFLLQQVEGCFLRRFRGLLHFRLRKGFPVHFLIDIQGDGVDLHRHGRDHIGRFPVQDEGVQGVDVHGGVADDIGRQELAAALAFLVEGLHRDVRNAGEFPDDAFHFLQFDAEPPDLHLHIPAADEFDVTVGPVTHDVARPVHRPPGRLVGERIVDEHFGRLVRPSQIAQTYLQAGHHQFAGGTHRQAAAALAHHIGPDARQRPSDGDVGLLDGHVLADDIDRGLRGTVAVMERELGDGEAGHFLTAGVQGFEGLVLREVDGELRGHLRGHQRVGDAVLLDEVVQGEQVQADFLRDDVQDGPRRDGGGEVVHIGVKAETGIGGRMGGLRDAQGGLVVPGEDGNVAVRQLDALGDAGRAAGVQEDEAVVRLRGRNVRLCVGEAGDVPGQEYRALIAADERLQAGIGDEEGGAGVLHHEGEAFGRIGWIQRLIGAAGLEGAERRDRHILVPVQDDGDHASRLDDGSNAGGQVVGQAVQLGIRERRVAEHHGRVVREAPDILPEGVQEGLVRVAWERARVERRGFRQLPVGREGEASDGFGGPHRQETGGEAVGELPENAFGVLVGPIAAGQAEGTVVPGRQVEGQGIIADFGLRVLRAIKMDREARFQVPDAVFIGITFNAENAILLFLALRKQF